MVDRCLSGGFSVVFSLLLGCWCSFIHLRMHDSRWWFDWSLLTRRSTTTLIIALVWCVLHLGIEGIPDAHRIETVPYHRQINDYTCGDASLQMVLEYYGTKVRQEQLISVARTTSEQGTLSTDILRAFHFSSTSQSMMFPTLPHSSIMLAGYPFFPIGLLALQHDAPQPIGHEASDDSIPGFWLPQLCAIIADDIPGENNGQFLDHDFSMITIYLNFLSIFTLQIL